MIFATPSPPSRNCHATVAATLPSRNRRHRHNTTVAQLSPPSPPPSNPFHERRA
ncbi:MAG: hypothetical protein OXU71_02945 [Gammaproteobacteria bacterium]|nr:hypothetical protein [Gammaproteobacteria bacterium]